ncbi:CU044_2847 family protein [Catellatospora citrea]|uniref:CU044_2847 family protein n=1 Tax=Catellatospora citrea TaxID=53366 RepID=UPI0019406AD9|nr:CU044_2847 family protein [Catellatospora citrea]
MRVEVDGLQLLIETTPVSPVGTEETATGDRAAKWLLNSFDRMQDALERIAVSTGHVIARAAKVATSPDVVEVELGLSLSAKGDVILVGGSGDATLKVTMTYNRRADEIPDAGARARTPAAAPSAEGADAGETQ